jgi:hypothetical protein
MVGLRDVLECHLAAEKVGGGFACLLREKFANEPYILLCALSGRHKARVVTDAAISSELADEA